MISNKKIKLPEQPKRSLTQQFLALYGLYGEKVKKKNTTNIWTKLGRYMSKLWKRNTN